MEAESQELGPYKPVSDVLILAAIERAACHGTEQVWVAVIGEHLGFQHAAQNDALVTSVWDESETTAKEATVCLRPPTACERCSVAAQLALPQTRRSEG
jgi:hypothetical protein